MAADLTHNERHGVGGKGKPTRKIKAADRTDHSNRADLQQILVFRAPVPKTVRGGTYKPHIFRKKPLSGMPCLCLLL